MEINEKELGKIAGGTVVETKEGKFVLMPPDAKEFSTKEEAEEAEKNFMKDRPHGHGHHFGHGGFMPPRSHMGAPKMDNESEESGPEGPKQ